MRDAASVLITLAALYLCWVLARPFLALITWALALVCGPGLGMIVYTRSPLLLWLGCGGGLGTAHPGDGGQASLVTQ